MTITLSADLEAVLNDLAGKRSVSVEALALEALRQRFLPTQPRDEWERGLLAAATDCGVSLSDEALSREEMYD